MQTAVNRESIYRWILELCNPEMRESAMLELCKTQEAVPELAPLLWHKTETIFALIEELTNIHSVVCTGLPTITENQSRRACNAIDLMQCVASHPETRAFFLQFGMLIHLYPFLKTVSNTRPLECLRLSSLDVIRTLLKTNELQVISFLLTHAQVIPMLLRIMINGSELSKTMATFILQKILIDDRGLTYVCQTYDRFYYVSTTLGKMVLELAERPSARVLKHVVCCYVRLCDNPRAREALRYCLPDQLRDDTFQPYLQENDTTKHWLEVLVNNLRCHWYQPQPYIISDTYEYTYTYVTHL